MVIEQWLKFLLRGAKRAPPTVGKREKRETRERADGDRREGGEGEMGEERER
jgi:hypothetical protein